MRWKLWRWICQKHYFKMGWTRRHKETKHFRTFLIKPLILSLDEQLDTDLFVRFNNNVKCWYILYTSYCFLEHCQFFYLFLLWWNSKNQNSVHTRWYDSITKNFLFLIYYIANNLLVLAPLFNIKNAILFNS